MSWQTVVTLAVSVSFGLILVMAIRYQHRARMRRWRDAWDDTRFWALFDRTADLTWADISPGIERG